MYHISYPTTLDIKEGLRLLLFKSSGIVAWPWLYFFMFMNFAQKYRPEGSDEKTITYN